MNESHFDRLARLCSGAHSRRETLTALTLAAFGALAAVDQGVAGPGCKNIGRKCKKAKQCCSGVCKGKRGRKRCKAHDSGGCRAGQRSESCGGVDIACVTSTGNPGICDTTTGNAGFCAFSGDCFPCKKDADCRNVCGPRAACIRCESTCFGVGGTACFGPGACDF